MAQVVTNDSPVRVIYKMNNTDGEGGQAGALCIGIIRSWDPDTYVANLVIYPMDGLYPFNPTTFKLDGIEYGTGVGQWTGA